MEKVTIRLGSFSLHDIQYEEQSPLFSVFYWFYVILFPEKFLIHIFQMPAISPLTSSVSA